MHKDWQGIFLHEKFLCELLHKNKDSPKFKKFINLAREAALIFI